MLDLSKLMVSVSGVRGKLSDGFTPEVILDFSLAFASSIPGDTIVIGRDSRPSGPFIESILNGAILASGKNVLSLGIVPTPTVKAVVQETHSPGGVVVSASHNPLEWNAFKFIGKGGFFFRQEEMDAILEKVKNRNFFQPVFNKPVSIQESSSLVSRHIDSVLSRVDVLSIRKKNFKVAIDAVNGAGSTIIPQFLEKLGCEVYKLHCKPDGLFPRPPEPTPEALVQTGEFVKEYGVDIGFAVDPDADRLVVVTPKRGPISEEYTLPLCLLSVLKNFVGVPKIAINESTSFLSEKIVKKAGGRVIRTKVGEANVVDAMLENNAVFGGEGNGGVIDPKVASIGRDSLTGMAHILQLLVYQNQSIDSILDTLPPIYIRKQSFPRGNKDLNFLYEKLEKVFPEGEISRQDGFRIAWENGWIHLRPSNTEPIFRLIGEASSQEELDFIFQKVEKTFQT